MLDVHVSRLRAKLDRDFAVPLLRTEKDVFGRPDDRLWTPVDADLAAWAGEEVEIFLAGLAELDDRAGGAG